MATYGAGEPLVDLGADEAEAAEALADELHVVVHVVVHVELLAFTRGIEHGNPDHGGPPFESDAYRTGGRRHCQASGSEPAAGALTGGEILETGGPPARTQRLRELRRQA